MVSRLMISSSSDSTIVTGPGNGAGGPAASGPSPDHHACAGRAPGRSSRPRRGPVRAAASGSPAGRRSAAPTGRPIAGRAEPDPRGIDPRNRREGVVAGHDVGEVAPGVICVSRPVLSPCPKIDRQAGRRMGLAHGLGALDVGGPALPNPWTKRTPAPLGAPPETSVPARARSSLATETLSWVGAMVTVWPHAVGLGRRTYDIFAARPRARRGPGHGHRHEQGLGARRRTVGGNVEMAGNPAPPWSGRWGHDTDEEARHPRAAGPRRGLAARSSRWWLASEVGSRSSAPRL